MDQELTYKWIQDRLRELNSGTLTEQDRLRLVEIAKDDPFVLDAMEGFDAHPDAAHEAHLNALTQKIKHTKRERRRWLIPNLTVTAIAASVLLIIATYAVITRIEKKAEETLFVFVAPDSLLKTDTVFDDIVMEPGSGVSTSAGQKTDLTGMASRKDNSQKSARGENKKTTNQQPVFDSESTKKTDVTSVESAKHSAPISSPATAPSPDEPKPESIEIAVQSTYELAGDKRDEGYYTNQLDPDIMGKRVTGRVTDALGQPLIGANLNISNTNLGTTTDLHGRFELFLPLPLSDVAVSLTGYQDAIVVLHQGEEEELISLTALNTQELESVVAGKAARAQGDKSPVSGAAANDEQMITDTIDFLDYLKANSRYPLRDNFYSPGNNVTLEFTVTADRKPGFIKVITPSNSKYFDTEAVRLIKKGPAWNCEGEVYPCTRKFTFYFQ